VVEIIDPDIEPRGRLRCQPPRPFTAHGTFPTPQAESSRSVAISMTKR
jgi:hypothetical protein